MFFALITLLTALVISSVAIYYSVTGLAAIFAASNFPYAFSVIGGDSASAIAAGCPIIVKAHPSHPNTCKIIHGAVVEGFKKSGLVCPKFNF